MSDRPLKRSRGPSERLIREYEINMKIVQARKDADRKQERLYMAPILAHAHENVPEFLQSESYARALNSLTDYELDSIYLYRSSASYRCIPWVHDGIVSALSKMPPLTRPIVLFRGQSTFKTIRDNDWFSTSFNEGIASVFTTSNPCCLFALTIMPGVKVLPVFTLSTFRRGNTFTLLSESEVIVECGIVDLQPSTYEDVVQYGWNEHRKIAPLGIIKKEIIKGYYYPSPKCARNSGYNPSTESDWTPHIVEHNRITRVEQRPNQQEQGCNVM